jgi:hypothetical protein
MIRISLPYLFDLSDSLEPLGKLPEQPAPYKDVWLSLVIAEGTLQTLMTGSLFAGYLRSSRPLAEQLLNALRAQTSKPDMERQLNAYELWSIKNTYGQFKTVLLAELGSFNSYFVTQKGAFDMFSLLAAGEAIFPSDLASKVPEALADAREAAKALAYEVPTACGFHTFRVTESVLRRYYSHVTGGSAPPKVRNIGVYLNALKQATKGDEKIRAALRQMTDLHRNPLIHPEVILTTEEAIATLGIARSAITAMLAVLPVQPPTTSTPVATGTSASRSLSQIVS